MAPQSCYLLSPKEYSFWPPHLFRRVLYAKKVNNTSMEGGPRKRSPKRLWNISWRYPAAPWARVRLPPINLKIDTVDLKSSVFFSNIHYSESANGIILITSLFSYIRTLSMTHVQFWPNDLSLSGDFNSYEVKCVFFAPSFWQNRDRALEIAPKCFPHRDASTDMHH